MRKIQILISVSFLFSFVSFLLGRTGYYGLSGIVLIAGALTLYLYQYKESRHLFHLPALYSLFWLGGEGIACLKLSRLSSDWSVITWICFYLAYAAFITGYGLLDQRLSENWDVRRQTPAVRQTMLRCDQGVIKRLYQSITVIFAVSLACFILEAVLLGFIPLFSDEPHAYSYFHISGVHYFTVSCVLVLPLTVLYIWTNKRIMTGQMIKLAGMNMIALFIPILCVSRFQLMLSVFLAVCVYASLEKRFKLRHLFLIAVLFVPLYVGLTVARNHDVAYLNGIFEMKNEKMPIFITQPYMYVANNYENFNCMVEQLSGHTLGLKMLFPVFALTGLKFVFPGLVSFPLYVTKTELTTVTLIYDAYYDFGIIGVAVFTLLLGMSCALLQQMIRKSKNPVSYLFYGQIAMYLMFSFFTTWFSNPTTWFWLAVTVIIYLYVGGTGIERSPLERKLAGK